MKNLKGRIKRKLIARHKLHGTKQRPRMSVFRSLNNIYVQVIDDDNGVTMTAASSLDDLIKKKNKELDKKGLAKEVGKLVAEKCKKIGVKKVIFERSGYKYHGRVAAIAEGAREGGLNF